MGRTILDSILSSGIKKVRLPSSRTGGDMFMSMTKEKKLACFISSIAARRCRFLGELDRAAANECLVIATRSMNKALKVAIQILFDT